MACHKALSTMPLIEWRKKLRVCVGKRGYLNVCCNIYGLVDDDFVEKLGYFWSAQQ